MFYVEEKKTICKQLYFRDEGFISCIILQADEPKGQNKIQQQSFRLAFDSDVPVNHTYYSTAAQVLPVQVPQMFRKRRTLQRHKPISFSAT